MSNVHIIAADPGELQESIVKQVVAELRPLIERSSEPLLVDRHRLATLLGVSVPTISRMTSSGEIPSKLIGTRRLYCPAAVVDALPDGGPN